MLSKKSDATEYILNDSISMMFKEQVRVVYGDPHRGSQRGVRVGFKWAGGTLLGSWEHPIFRIG